MTRPIHSLPDHSPAPVRESVAERDDRLLAGVRTGDESAFEELYLAYHLPLWKFAYGYVRSREVAEELIQDVFLTLWRRRTDIEVRESIRVWLYGAARNLALKHQRHVLVVGRSDRAAQHRDIPGDHAVCPPGMGQPPTDAEATLAGHDLETAITRAVDALPERRRLAVTLRWKHGLSPVEIARIIGTTPESVRVLLSRARKDLLTLLGAGWLDP